MTLLPNRNHHLVVAKGQQSGLAALDAAFSKRFPTLRREAPEQTKSYADMFKADLGGFRKSNITGDGSVAFTFDAAPASSPTCPPPGLVDLRNFIQNSELLEHGEQQELLTTSAVSRYVN